MLIYPNLDPVAFRLGPFSVHWYGLMYLLGFLFVWGCAMYQAKRQNPPWSREQVSDLIFYGAVGVILGGRIGYMLFYDFSGLLADPISLFKIWQGGMSFHGGLIGVLLSFVYFGKRQHFRFLQVSDFVAPLAPLGFATGRLGNFINGELWGRVTEMPWGMVFPHVDLASRHPSQLYELFLEGVVLFIGLQYFIRKPRPIGAVSFLFLLGYGAIRFFAEFFREPDEQYGFIAWNWLTMGQLLSLPMAVLGFLGLIWIYTHRNKPSAAQ